MANKANFHLNILIACILLFNFPWTPIARADQNISKPASFTVTTDVINKDVQPFTATIGGFGNSLIKKGSGFEPVIYRNQFIATKNDPNKIFVDRNSLTHYDTIAEGFFDDATAHVYRINNGRFQLIRTDQIAAGGSHASGWIPVMQSNKIIAKNSTSYNFYWNDYNKPDAVYYFTVRAIDKYGNLSTTSNVFRIKRKKHIRSKSKAKNTIIAFRKARSLFSTNRQIKAPKNLTGVISADGGLLLKWQAADASDLAGYLVYRSDYPPHKHSGYFLQLLNNPKTSAENILAGDMVILNKKIYSPSRNKDLTNRVWGASGETKKIMPGLIGSFPDENKNKIWQLTPHQKNTPVTEAGETYLELDLKSNTSESIKLYNHSGTQQSWYDVLEQKTYTVEVWLRQEGTGTAKFEMTGAYHKGKRNFTPIVFDVGKNWKKYVATFTPNITQKSPRPHIMALVLSGPAKFNIDNFRVYRSDTPYLELLPRDVSALKAAKLLAIRTHGLIKTDSHTYNMEQLTNTGGVINGTSKLNTLPQSLRMMKKIAVTPWLQIEYHMDPTEWLGFVEYLAAPYDPEIDSPEAKPWAFKRFNQGHPKPWSDEFSKFYFELSNETWNSLFRPWVFRPMIDTATKKKYSSGKVYGMYQEYVISILRSSPYWKSANLEKKFKFVLGGWSAQKQYGLDAASSSPTSEILGLAAYNGGWDENEGPARKNISSLFNTLAQVSQGAIPIADNYSMAIRSLGTDRARSISMGTYEAGPGYALNGLNNARVTKEQASEQEQVMKSLAAGTATLDSFLARAYRGYTIQNFFTFDRGNTWKSHAKWFNGGHDYPSWKLISLFNNFATGEMLRTEDNSVPSTDLQAFSRRKSVKNAPLAAIYATRKNKRYSVIVISRKTPGFPDANDDGFTPVKISLPFSSAKAITLYRLTGDPFENNITADNVKIEKINITASLSEQNFILDEKTGADSRGIPPASTFLYVFDDVNTR